MRVKGKSQGGEIREEYRNEKFQIHGRILGEACEK